MTDFPTEAPATPSPSTPPPTPAASPAPAAGRVNTPPLRVATAGRPTPSRTTTPGTAAGGGSGTGSDPIGDSPTPTPSSGSKGHAVKVDKAALGEIVRGAVLTASLWVHRILARTEEEQALKVWIADAQDQRQIGDPLGAIATRHGVPDAPNSDTADLIAAGIGALAYLAKHGMTAFAIRLDRRRQRRNPTQQNPSEERENS